MRSWDGASLPGPGGLRVVFFPSEAAYADRVAAVSGTLAHLSGPRVPFEVKGASYPYFGMVNVRNYADTVVYGYTTPTSNTYMPPEPLVVGAVHRMADEMHNGRGPKTR